MKYNLSYVLTTFNKLSYLKSTLPDLIAACKDDEEIVIMDGGSTDGTREYIDALYQDKKVHQFISEKDYGEANGYNKAMLRANGELIKIISDDDAYYYPGIERCKKQMLENKDVQVVAADGFAVNNLLQHNDFSRRHNIEDFKKWKDCKTPFIFCGLSILFRKDAIPLIGLWDGNFIIIDFEFSLRITSSKVRLGWYEELFYVNIVNQQSNSGRHWKRMELEKERLEHFYLNKRKLVSYNTKDRFKEMLRPIKYRLFPTKIINPVSYEEIYKQSKEQLEFANKSVHNASLLY